jgi:dihydroorotase (multifunctional complex type)
MAEFDLLISNGEVCLPSGVVSCDIGVRDGVIASLERGISGNRAARTIDAGGQIVFPGAVDAHSHIGIYRPLGEDATTESTSALFGGVTTILSYFRTGSNYLNMSGPYLEVFPQVLAACESRFLTDYGFHLAPMLFSHVDEIPELLQAHGVSTFKFYTFYKLLNLAASGTSRDYIKSEDDYDAGHLYRIMRVISSLSRQHGRSVRLSVHCEDPEVIRLFLSETKTSPDQGLDAYSAARPPLAEASAIAQVALLAQEAKCPVNFLHLSSEVALKTAAGARRQLKGLDATIEVTLHHLALDNTNGHAAQAKVNPPIRTRKDNEALWAGVVDGTVDIVASDHACHHSEGKGEDLWEADPGFGGMALLVPLMITEAHLRRSVPLPRVAELVSANPARYHGLYPKKGVIAPGSDADLLILDMDSEKTVTPEVLHSAQDFTPFEGMRLKGWPTHTIVRGQVALEDGRVVAEPGIGQYIKRPISKL